MKGKSRTQAERSATTKDALIRAARDLFAEHGFADVGTEAIVRAAGVTRGAMYHHFADKTELFAAVFETVEAELTAQIATVAMSAPDPDPIELMRLGARTWLEACSEPAAERIVLIEAPSVLGWERWREIGLQHGMGLVRALIEQAISVGRIAQQPIDPLAHVLIGALDEAALFVARADDRESARSEVGAVLEQLIAALSI